MGVRVQLESGSIEIQRMTSYLLVVEHGCLIGPACARAYRHAVEQARDEHAVRLMVIDARVDVSESDSDAQAALWQWLADDAFDRVAIVADDEMRATELNMEALSQGMRVRAFTSLSDAGKWVQLADSPRGQVHPISAP